MIQSKSARTTKAGSPPADTPACAKRGRPAAEEWLLRARYVLRYLEDPISLQRSPLCRLRPLEELAEARYPGGIVARGRAVNDLAHECLAEIEAELDGHARVEKLKRFVTLTRDGNSVSQASRALGVSREWGSRTLKQQLVGLLAEKLQSKLR